VFEEETRSKGKKDASKKRTFPAPYLVIKVIFPAS